MTDPDNGPENGPDLADRAGTWPVVATTDVFRTRIPIAVRADEVQRPGHPEEPTFTRLVVEHPGAAVVLALDERDRVACLRQYRHPAGATFVELPAGLCDTPGEDPLAVAVRELREEMGLQAQLWTHLATAYSSPGISSEKVHYYLAREVAPADRSDVELRHEEAEMEALWLPFPELLRGVLDGVIGDGPLLIAVLMAHARHLVPSGLSPE